MEMRALIKVYRDLYEKGKITGAGILRHNELVKKYREKLMKSFDSKTSQRLKKMQYIKTKDKKWKLTTKTYQLHLSLGLKS